MELGLVRTLLIDESTFENCSGKAGGALRLSQGFLNEAPIFAQQTLRIRNSRFINNRATGDGGSSSKASLQTSILSAARFSTRLQQTDPAAPCGSKALKRERSK